MTMPLRYLRLLPHGQLRRPRSRLSLNLRGERHSSDETPQLIPVNPTDLLGRLEKGQLKAFPRLQDTVPSHIRRIDFALDASGWDATAIDALSSTLTEFADVLSSSKLDYGECSPRNTAYTTAPLQTKPGPF